MSRAQVLQRFAQIDESERKMSKIVREAKRDDWESAISPPLEEEPPTPVDYSSRPAPRSQCLKLWAWFKRSR